MSNSPITQEQFISAYADYVADLPLYCERFLKILSKETVGKSGGMIPFTMNKAQLYIHKKLEEQRRATGKVRAIILKGRQQGCSTYVGARFYHKATHTKGGKVFIVTHHNDATNNLFSMVNNYHECIPECLRATTCTANAKEIAFAKLKSGYRVGTAGSKGVGRSQTIHYLHGSEVAFWDNAEEHTTGLLQAVSNERGTEIILESTANGIGNLFYNMVQDALAGNSEYELIFVPWYWQPEYSEDVPSDFQLSEEEQSFKEMYEGLTDGNLQWRRNKIKGLGNKEWKFKQEYPFDIEEAFQNSGIDSFIPSRLVKEAMVKTTFHDNQSPLIVGVDVASKDGADRTAIAYRRGRVCDKIETFDSIDTMEVVNKIVQIIQGLKPDKVFIDKDGLGFGVVDRLNELKYGSYIHGVQSGSQANNAEQYFNKRAEMWGLLRDWLEDKPNRLFKNDGLLMELCAGGWHPHVTRGSIVLEKKENIKKVLGRSPDMADALALTFAEPIAAPAIANMTGRTFQANIDYDVWG